VLPHATACYAMRGIPQGKTGLSVVAVYRLLTPYDSTSGCC
jgi:hypothetical protein